MLVYNFHPFTGEYLGSSLADESPLEPGVFLLPGFATEIEPPEQRPGFIRRFVDDVWEYTPIEEPEVDPDPDLDPKPYVPDSISDRQFFQILAKMELITKEEARAAVKTGDMPAVFEAFIASMPEENRFDVQMLLEGATEFMRNHPIIDTFAAGFGMTAADVDQLWIDASQL